MAGKKSVFEKYRLVGIELGIHQFAGFGTIDLNQLSIHEADALVKRGFKHLVIRRKNDPEESSEPDPQA